jgi:hypothetical protein
LALWLAVFSQAQTAPKPIEKTLGFPSPVQWQNNGVSISLVGLAWGPANSPEMMAKARKSYPADRPEILSDRSYLIALGFEARMPRPGEMWMASSLVHIKDVSGDMERPWALTASGLVQVQGGYDIHFSGGNVTQYWDLFPASPGEKEFLFEVLVQRTTQEVLSFRVLRRDDDFLVINTTPGRQTACLQFEKNFAGTIGADTQVTLGLTRQGTVLSGAEQYATIGKTLWLSGSVDSLGNFIIEENYPKDTLTGKFSGTFSADCRKMSGRFSKPNGSLLQPFEFREVP